MLSGAFLSVLSVIVFALGFLTMLWAPQPGEDHLRTLDRQLQPTLVGSAAVFIATGAMIYEQGWLGFPFVSIVGGTIGYIASLTLPRQAIAASYILSVAGSGLLLARFLW